MTLGDALPADLVTDNGGFNRQRIRAAEIPGAGGIATAKALATIWSATVAKTQGIRLLGDAVIAEATGTQSQGMPVFGGEPPFPVGAMAFSLIPKRGAIWARAASGMTVQGVRSASPTPRARSVSALSPTG